MLVWILKNRALFFIIKKGKERDQEGKTAIINLKYSRITKITYYRQVRLVFEVVAILPKIDQENLHTATTTIKIIIILLTIILY